MNFGLVGLSHKTAPVEIRERLAIPEAALPQALEALRLHDGIREGLILSTCNRVEVFARGRPDSNLADSLPAFLAAYHGLPLEELNRYLYRYEQREAIRHLFRVTASLDSMVVGEPQILGQVKNAYALARAAGTASGLVEEVMMRAFSVAKKVRSETGVAQSAVSISYAAVELARKIFGSLEGKHLLLIGAGKMSELASRHLLRSGAASLMIVNRSLERAQELAQEFGGQAVPFERLFDCLARADIVISSTGAPHFILKKEDGPGIMHRRRQHPMFFIDIAVPRDIDPALNEVDNIFVYDIDDLQQVVQANLAERQREAERGEQIIEHEVDRFLARARGLEVVPTIVSLQERLEDIRKGEIERVRGKLGALSPDQEQAIEALTRAMINKFLHEPITQLKSAAQQPESRHYIDIIRRVFNLK
jgi:glutamyl-tRNA reductase